MSVVSVPTNLLYRGDNRLVLQDFESSTIDVCYLDPPFSSKRDYFLNFKDDKGRASETQSTAFVDTWTWGEESVHAWDRLHDSASGAPATVRATLGAFLTMLGRGPMLAYLVSMAERLLHMHRVLKPTGSLWLHCDPTAGAYLKLLLDAIFGPTNFRNEICWKRQSAHSDARHKLPDVMDTLYYYAKSPATPVYPQYTAHDPEYIKDFYKNDDADGRGLYQLADMASPNPRPNLMYQWMGYPHPIKGWRYSQETMQKLHDENRLHYPKNKDGSPDITKRIRLKRYLSEQEGSIVTNVWTDIAPVQSRGEALGYPTQKPLSLLRRVLAISSKPGDIVLDPYCGCGTAVVAAHEMERRWIGIDLAPLAIKVMENRLKGFPDIKIRGVTIKGLPTTFEQAKDLAARDKHLFQQWACYYLLGGRSLDKKGPDKGIDGWRSFVDVDGTHHQIVIQVKGGKNISSKDVRDFCHVVNREKATLGFFVCLTGDDDKNLGPMRQEALSVGMWKSASGLPYPKVQILPVASLLSGAIPPRFPSQQDIALNGYHAPKHVKKGAQATIEYL